MADSLSLPLGWKIIEFCTRKISLHIEFCTRKISLHIRTRTLFLMAFISARPKRTPSGLNFVPIGSDSSKKFSKKSFEKDSKSTSSSSGSAEGPLTLRER